VQLVCKNGMKMQGSASKESVAAVCAPNNTWVHDPWPTCITSKRFPAMSAFSKLT